MATNFHIQVADLQTTVAQTLAQEVLIVRVLRPRDGMAGSTVKWECYLIDGSDSRSVLLADAWGRNIAKAKEGLKEGQVYKISNYVIADKGSYPIWQQLDQADPECEGRDRTCSGRAPRNSLGTPARGP